MNAAAAKRANRPVEDQDHPEIHRSNARTTGAAAPMASETLPARSPPAEVTRPVERRNASRVALDMADGGNAAVRRELAQKAPAAGAPPTHWPLAWSAFAAALLWWGPRIHLERYITPQRGIGYWLGITGGSLMVLSLLYSARKRAAWMRWLGGTSAWFTLHMTLGIAGPILVLFHSNFSFGATNSNVALVCMLLVAGSGVIGRYVYTRLHAQMDGSEESLEQLKAVGERLRTHTTSIAYLPGLAEAVERIERRLIIPPRGKAVRLLHLSTGIVRMVLAKWLMSREIARGLERIRTLDRPRVLRYGEHIAAAARSYAHRRLEAGRRLHEYQLYAQIFSLWHVLHIPFFFMLLIAGITHVIAVNVY